MNKAEPFAELTDAQLAELAAPCSPTWRALLDVMTDAELEALARGVWPRDALPPPCP